MSVTSQGKSEANTKRIKTPWDEAIADAKRKIRALEQTIRVYRERKRIGDPWPSDLATHN